MAICPFATFKKVSRFNQPMAGYFRINAHQAVTTANSLFSWFNVWGRATTHFFIGEHGELEQYVDTAYQAGGDLDGNDVTISIECWDNGGKQYAYNDAQLATAIKLDVWLLNTHTAIPHVLAASSVPGHNKGLSWHRLGVPYRVLSAKNRVAAAFAPGYLQPGGVWYSDKAAKSCPGDGRIAQIQNIIYPAVCRELGHTVVTPVSNPEPTPPAKSPAPAPKHAAPKKVIQISPGVAAPKYPLPVGYYFGPKSGPVKSVSGFFSHRSDLKVWQSRMKARGWVINPDGYYGNETGNVAEAFQKEKHLYVDRLIGPATWAAAWTQAITRIV